MRLLGVFFLLEFQPGIGICVENFTFEVSGKEKGMHLHAYNDVLDLDIRKNSNFMLCSIIFIPQIRLAMRFERKVLDIEHMHCVQKHIRAYNCGWNLSNLFTFHLNLCSCKWLRSCILYSCNMDRLFIPCNFFV